MTKIDSAKTAPLLKIPHSAAHPEGQSSNLRSLKQLHGRALGAKGDLGKVEDFYFDDQFWTVRYVVADTNPWLTGRLVLISPYAFGSFHHDVDSMLVNLTRKQIEDSPGIESHKPVSRQFEAEYNRYYGWPTYWAGSAIWGMGGFPLVSPPPWEPVQEPSTEADLAEADDSHLQSTNALAGFHIETPDGSIGHLSDFLIDSKSWAISHLVIETGNWFVGKEIVILPKDVQSISFDDSKVYVDVTKQAIQEAPEYHLPQQPVRS